MSALISTLLGQCTLQACRNTSAADANFFFGQPRQSHTQGQLGSTSSASTCFSSSGGGIIWMPGVAFTIVVTPGEALPAGTGVVGAVGGC
uniref:Putative secreted protein n=1 Tax=Anopheles triannulatus TaxID=58253 RepID=A0A2M4B4D7_9DIPT